MRNKLDIIKSLGDSNPQRALLMCDSLRNELSEASKHIRMVEAMLEMRLRDKAFIPATTTDSAKLIVDYFDSHGNKDEAAEAHYYAGSVYRDVKDFPNSMKQFLIAEKLLRESNNPDCMMLLNTYSNLTYVYYYVQDYKNALQAALREYDISKEINELNIVTIIDVAESYLMSGNDSLAYNYYREALDLAVSSGVEDKYSGSLYALLQDFSSMNKTSDADKCYSLILKMGKTPPPLQLGNYYRLKNEMDSAASCFRKTIAESSDLLISHDAAGRLYRMYRENEDSDADSILKYANLYIEFADSLNLGKRQEMAATINNQYKYFRNIEEETIVKEESARVRMWLYVSIGMVLFLSFLYLLLSSERKNRHLKEKIQLTEQLSSALSDTEALRGEIDNYKAQLKNSEMALSNTKQNLERVNKEIANCEAELKNNEEILSEKLEENRRFILLLHKADLEENAEDVVNMIKKASEGKYKMKDIEWRKFFHAVDELQPDLSVKISQKLGKFSEQQQQVCYLLSIGLSNTQIENLTNIPHVTVWRWTKKFDWVRTKDASNMD